ncbi:hypothetical protein [Halomonas halocynthiae]|uniref:hypothetical protein n=1 Tax=Halomonas halocynthiae TaxID=176290 RepID=UPI0004138C91|nr:hypothetical protein [Halomonas halocynthiae]
MTNPSRLTLLAVLLTLPSLGNAQANPNVLSLPLGASVEMALISPLALSAETSHASNIIMHPVNQGIGSHNLPNYCVLTGDAQRDDDRVIITAKQMTCIEATGADSAIFSGKLSAAAYDADNTFGLPVCQDSGCTLTPTDSFILTFNDAISIEQQRNPSAEINAMRRQHGKQAESSESQ